MYLNAAVYWLKIFSCEESLLALDFGITPVLFIFLTAACQFFFTSYCIMLCGSLPSLLSSVVEYFFYQTVPKSPFNLFIRTHLGFFLLCPLSASMKVLQWLGRRWISAGSAHNHSVTFMLTLYIIMSTNIYIIIYL